MKFMGEKKYFSSGVPIELSTTNHFGSALLIYEFLVEAIDRGSNIANTMEIINRRSSDNLDNNLKSIEEVSARNEITAKHEDTRQKTDFSQAIADR